MWSVGVVILELILGSPNVFQISAYTRALLDQQLEGWSEGLKELAYKCVLSLKRLLLLRVCVKHLNFVLHEGKIFNCSF